MTDITFDVRHNLPIDGVLTYISAESSFRFVPGSPAEVADRVGSQGVTSLAVGTLQAEVAIDSSDILYVWGYHVHRKRWTKMSCRPQGAKQGVVRVVTTEPLQRGVSVAIADGWAWSTMYDKSSGWIRISPSWVLEDDLQVEIASATILGFCDMKFNSIWLQPIFD